MSRLPSSSTFHLLFRPWLLLFECLSNPLWFPLACFGLLPLLTFLLLKREAASRGEDDGARRELSSVALKVDLLDAEEEEEEERPRSASRRLLAAVLFLYYAVFIYDLVAYGNLVEESEDLPSLDFTHTEFRRLPEKASDGSLVCVYVFWHWTRALAAVARNAMVKINWRAIDKKRVLHV